MPLNEIGNWSEAVFISQTLACSTQNCYADRLSSSDKGKWCVHAATKQDSTVIIYINKER
jgi:hypothetical protein